ncbi:hypothetical protein FTX61_08405 [Nitriliruptoraceae bacterium ZYF776]|nr:hypothetical protein [Profundirhabdus halotolerans]
MATGVPRRLGRRREASHLVVARTSEAPPRERGRGLGGSGACGSCGRPSGSDVRERLRRRTGGGGVERERLRPPCGVVSRPARRSPRPRRRWSHRSGAAT